MAKLFAEFYLPAENKTAVKDSDLSPPPQYICVYCLKTVSDAEHDIIVVRLYIGAVRRGVSIIRSVGEKFAFL